MIEIKKRIVTFGEIMLRITPSVRGEKIAQANDFIIEPGGSESNVAIALSQLGYPCSFVTKLPEGVLTEKILRYLKSYSVDTSNIVFGGDRVGVYWTEAGAGPRASQVLYDRKHSAFAESSFTDYQWKKIFTNASWIHTSGISAAVSKSSYDVLKKLFSKKKAGINLSIDLNFRSKLWEWVKKKKAAIHKVMWDLCSNAELISGNESDYFDALGIAKEDTCDIETLNEIAGTCFKRLKRLSFLAVSLRTPISASENGWSGILYVKRGRKIECYKGVEMRVTNIVDRIGTGDTYLAGILFGLTAYKNDFQQTVDFAVGLSALKHSVKGDASQFTKIDVENLLKHHNVKIQR
ncbi:MAG: sugar kinase [bacterium]